MITVIKDLTILLQIKPVIIGCNAAAGFGENLEFVVLLGDDLDKGKEWVFFSLDQGSQELSRLWKSENSHGGSHF